MSGKRDFGAQEDERRIRSRAMRLMEALSGADEELLERCEDGNAAAYRRPVWHRTKAMAAVLCLAVVGAASFYGYRQLRMSDNTSYSGGANQAAVPQDIPEAAEEKSEDMREVENVAGAGAADQTGQDAGVAEGRGETAGGAGKEEGASMDSEGSDIKQQEAAMEENRSPEIGEPDEAGCPANPARELTETQVRADAALGGYIPEVIPEGYVFEDASYMPEEAEANLSICWTRGMDSVFLYLKKPAELPATVDVDRTELYDVRLYDIPYAETVPEEYREIFDDPVFAGEDLSLEVVRSRMKSYDDAGDTDTPRGNFSVLYQDGVLVRFAGRGTAEEIWEMFCSMGKGR